MIFGTFEREIIFWCPGKKLIVGRIRLFSELIDAFWIDYPSRVCIVT